MRILQVVAADRWTGAAAVALQLTEALRAAGIDCQLAYRRGNNLQERVRGLPWCHAALRKERSWKDVREVLASVHRFADEMDVVHCHLPHDHLLAATALRRRRTMLVRSVHHPRHVRGDPFYRWLLRRCDGVACAAGDLLARCRRIPFLAAVPLAVLPAAAAERFHAVGRERFIGENGERRRSVRGRLGIPGDAVVAGCVGKLDRGRGHDLLLHALAGAPGVWGMVVGHGPWEEHLRRLARRLSVADRVAFAGYVEEGLEGCHAAMDLFVLPEAGSQWSHRAVAEAAATGLPTLAADLAGVRDVVTPGEDGALFPRGDAAALAVLLRAWGGAPERRKLAGESAARRAGREHTEEALAAAAVELYQRVGVGATPAGAAVR